MDKMDEIFIAIQSLTSLIEENMKEQNEVKKEVKELKNIVNHHNKLIIELSDKYMTKEDENYIIEKLNILEKQIKANKFFTASFIIATLIGFYYSLK